MFSILKLSFDVVERLRMGKYHKDDYNLLEDERYFSEIILNY